MTPPAHMQTAAAAVREAVIDSGGRPDFFGICCAITDVHVRALLADPTLAARLDAENAAEISKLEGCDV